VTLLVRPLAAAEVPAVVVLHRAALPYSLNCRLGAAHLARLYQGLLGEPGAQVTAAASGGQIIGVVSVLLDPDRFVQAFLRRQTLPQWAGLAARVAVQPTLLRAWRSSRETGRPLVYEAQTVGPVLSAIAVAAEARRQGVGHSLVASVDAFVRQHGRPAYSVDTRVSNQAARAFYARLGFVEVEIRGENVMLVRAL
jgi:ribosomal protein S18 acetylase RimI-like enzyme